jgi:hypothetical protein
LLLCLQSINDTYYKNKNKSQYAADCGIEKNLENLKKIATISPKSSFIVSNNSGSSTASKTRYVFSSTVTFSNELALIKHKSLGLKEVKSEV